MIDLHDATDAHIPTILEIYNHEIATSTGVCQDAPHTLDMRRAWVRDKQAHGFPVIVAVEDGTVLGGVVLDNVASVRLHEALGFVEVAHFRQVGFKFGRWLDLKFYEKVLDEPADGARQI